MAVYGKGRAHRAIPLRHRPGRIITEWEPRRPHRIELTRPRRDSFPAHSISVNLGFPIGGWINKRNRKTGKPVVVLDWGCKDGKGIIEFAHKYLDRVQAYGFSIDNHAAWTKTNFVKFIWNDPYRLLRYFKKESVDLIYSHFGFWKFFPQMHGITPDSPLTARDHAAMITYMQRLGARLKIGGVIVGHIRDDLVPHIQSFPWKDHGFKLRILSRSTVRDPYTRAINSAPPRIVLERMA